MASAGWLGSRMHLPGQPPHSFPFAENLGSPGPVMGQTGTRVGWRMGRGQGCSPEASVGTGRPQALEKPG